MSSRVSLCEPELPALTGHVMRLRAALLRYRLARDHAACQPCTGLLKVDTRCVLCRRADDVLCESILP
jgi:hypothetical protein